MNLKSIDSTQFLRHGDKRVEVVWNTIARLARIVEVVKGKGR